jgi:hypothetical protein
VRCGTLAGEMSRHTTFRFCLDPTVEQRDVLARHAGASRFAFNQCLAMVKVALSQRKTDPGVVVPWTGFDLINSFNAWKKTADDGRVFSVGSDRRAEIVVTGVAWRREVCQQVFEEAAVDLGKGLKAWSDSRCGKRNGKRVGFPRFKKKTGAVVSFRLRNNTPKAAHRRSGLARATGRVRSPCPGLARSRCMTTLAGCGPTTGSSSRTSTSAGCWPTLAWPEPSRTRAGQTSHGYCTTSKPGVAANSSSPIAGIRQAGSALDAVPCTAI